MKIEFQKPDTSTQIAALQTLLQLNQPTDEEVALALFITVLVFYENRPGKLYGKLDHYNIHGTGCHNPTSYKTNKTVRGIWRLHITIQNKNGAELIASYEVQQGGYLKGELKQGSSTQTMACSIVREKDTTTQAISVKSTGGTPSSFLKELSVLLKEPLETLLQCA